MRLSLLLLSLAFGGSALCGSFGASALEAQRPTTDCPAAERSARTDAHPAARVVRDLVRCSTAGTQGLVVLWGRHAALSDATLEVLVDASRWPRARAVTQQLEATLAGRHGARVTHAALAAAVSAFDVAFAPRADQMAALQLGAGLPKQMHAPASTPADRTQKARLAMLVAQLATGHPDATVRVSALAVRQQLALLEPGLTPLAPDAVQLVAKCGRQTELVSTADISLPVRLTVLGTTYDQLVGIGAAMNGTAARALLLVPHGVVVAKLGDREVARLTNRKVPCPPGVIP